MTQDQQQPDAVVILYEVFVGTMQDGKQVMVQVFRKKGDDKSMSAQLALRANQWETWAPPVRLDALHSVTETVTQ
jgi:hypothetical protein